MWLTSNRPACVRTASCSERMPEYSSGISQPPKLTILAPKRRWTSLRAVFLSRAVVGVITANILTSTSENQPCVFSVLAECPRQAIPPVLEGPTVPRSVPFARKRPRPFAGWTTAGADGLSSDSGVSYYGAEVRPDTAIHGRIARVKTLCSQCDKPESTCGCEKYCSFCQSQLHIRLCVDGLYYCPDCREACDVHVAEADDH